MSKELYKKYRPKTFADVIGQDHVIKPLQKMIAKDELPHAILLTGPKGNGKTTVGRILRRELQCSNWDFVEKNCSSDRGIDLIRDIERKANLAPMQGKTRVWLFDEVHMLTGEASNAFLKILEEPPAHVYFILCTTDPQKLIATIRSRCTEFALKPLGTAPLRKIITQICKSEKIELDEEVIDKLLVQADNSARNALVLLDKIRHVDAKNQLDTLSEVSIETAAIQIARTLFNPTTRWPDMAKVLKSTELQEVEGMRYLILAYAKTILLSGGKFADRAYQVIRVFEDNWYDGKAASLCACCYEIITGK